MANRLKPGVLLFPLMAPLVLPACVWKSDYDKVVAQNQQLQQQATAQAGEIATDKAQISRLQGAISTPSTTTNCSRLLAGRCPPRGSRSSPRWRRSWRRRSRTSSW